MPGVAVFRFDASLHFANKDFFRDNVVRAIEASTRLQRLRGGGIVGAAATPDGGSTPSVSATPEPTRWRPAKDAPLAPAVFADLSILVERFEVGPGHGLAEFKEAWQQMEFGRIFSTQKLAGRVPGTDETHEEYIVLLDTDMLLRAPLDPLALGARRGVVVSAEYNYLVGTNAAFAGRFLEPHELPLLTRCGGFHIFHKEDIRRIAPLWIEFTRRVRAFAHAQPETYFSESFLRWHEQEDVSKQRPAAATAATPRPLR